MKEIKKPNVKGPRFREGFKTLLSLQTLDAFKQKYPEYADLSLAEFKKIVMTFNKCLCQEIIDNRNGIELPEGLGFIFMGTCQKAKRKNIDFPKARVYGIEVINKNWDSDGKLLKIFYTNYNSKYPFLHRTVWSFKAVKQFRKQASEAYRQFWPKYIEVAPNELIAKIFERETRKRIVTTMKPVIPDEYDEFKM